MTFLAVDVNGNSNEISQSIWVTDTQDYLNGDKGLLSDYYNGYKFYDTDMEFYAKVPGGRGEADSVLEKEVIPASTMAIAGAALFASLAAAWGVRARRRRGSAAHDLIDV